MSVAGNCIIVVDDYFNNIINNMKIKTFEIAGEGPARIQNAYNKSLLRIVLFEDPGMRALTRCEFIEPYKNSAKMKNHYLSFFSAEL
jgi:hypothetical protein